MKLPRRKKTERFFKGFFAPVAALLVFFGLSAGVLYRAGEYMPMADIAAKLEKTGGVFGSSLHSQAFWYKQEVYKRIKPDIATLGSSRTLLLRRDHFNAPFANLGLMGSIDEEMEIAKALFDTHAPKVLLLEAPWWWFHPAPAASKAVKRSPAVVTPDIAALMQPVRWLLTGETTFGETLRMLLKPSPSVGVTGVLHDQGYDAVGSFRYTASLTGQTENKDKEFTGTIAKMKNGDKAFLGAKHVSPAQWKKFITLLDYLKSKDIHVVFFVPPVAPAVHALMQKDAAKFAYMQELSGKLEAVMQKYGFGYFDFHDAAKLGATDCEFVDGLHGGYIIYDRLLLEIAAADSKVSVNRALLERESKARRGYASTLKDEIDFLNLGCQR
ncbi:MAG: hypothetical protein ACAH80_13475 [Alphaproteobacteria bacterium]